MGQIIIGNAAGGVTSDDVTSTKANVLAGTTTITSDSNDEVVQGTMKDCGTYQYGGVGSGSDYIAINALPEGYYHKTSSDQNWAPEARATATQFGTATNAQVLSGYTFTSGAGLAINGAIPNRGGSQISKNAYYYTNSDGNTYLVSWIPGGYYNGWQTTSDGVSCCETWTPIASVNACVGKATLGVMSVRGFNGSSSDWTLSDEQSFTMPRSGTVYYGGMSAFYNSSSGSILCRILKNDVIVDSRDSNNVNGWRGTMFNKSFSANAGDVIKVAVSCSKGSHAVACIQAVIVY